MSYSLPPPKFLTVHKVHVILRFIMRKRKAQRMTLESAKLGRVNIIMLLNPWEYFSTPIGRAPPRKASCGSPAEHLEQMPCCSFLTDISAPDPPKRPSGTALGPFRACDTSGVFHFSLIQEAICSIGRTSFFPQNQDRTDNQLSKHLRSYSTRGGERSAGQCCGRVALEKRISSRQPQTKSVLRVSHTKGAVEPFPAQPLLIS